jgi:hypothetical protein
LYEKPPLAENLHLLYIKASKICTRLGYPSTGIHLETFVQVYDECGAELMACELLAQTCRFRSVIQLFGHAEKVGINSCMTKYIYHPSIASLK